MRIILLIDWIDIFHLLEVSTNNYINALSVSKSLLFWKIIIISFIAYIGANGLVDFYSELLDILFDHSTEYHPSLLTPHTSNHNYRSKIESKVSIDDLSFITALNQLFDGTNHKIDEKSLDSAFAFAVPTFQPTQNFMKRNNNLISFPQDIDVTRNTLFTTKQCFPHSSVYLSSAYLNPTPFLMEAIKRFGVLDKSSKSRSSNGASYLMTAAPNSHGFKPKKKNDSVNGSGKGWVPSVFLKLAEDISSIISGKILLYDREDFTFHAKGLWLTEGHSKLNQADESRRGQIIVDSENDLLATVIGSSNFGARSEVLDWESNCILVMNPLVSSHKEARTLRSDIAGEWNSMLEHCTDLGSRKDLKVDNERNLNWLISNVATQLARTFF